MNRKTLPPDSPQTKVPWEVRLYKSAFRADSSKGPCPDIFVFPMPSSSFLFRLLAQGRVGGRLSAVCAGSRGEAASRRAGTSAASPWQPWPPTTTLSAQQGCGCLRGIAKCGGWHLFLNVPRPPNWEPTQEVKRWGGNRGFLQATWLLSAPTPSPNASVHPWKPTCPGESGDLALGGDRVLVWEDANILEVGGGGAAQQGERA